MAPKREARCVVRFGVSTRGLLAFTLACAGLASSACSLLLPFGALIRGDASVEAGIGDASPGSQDALPEGPAVDAVAHEGGAMDAGLEAMGEEASPGAGFPDGSWCATQPAGMALCDDFDFETPQFERWTRHQIDVLGSAGFSTTAESPPRSFSLKTGALTANTYVVEALEQDVPPTPSATAVSLYFSLRPTFPWTDADGGPIGDGFMLVAGVYQGPVIPRSAFALQFDPGGISLREQDTAEDGGSTFPPPVYAQGVPDSGTWVHVLLDVDLAAAKATLTVEGTKVITLDLQGTWSPSAVTTMVLGDWYIHGTPGFELLYDDAVIRQR